MGSRIFLCAFLISLTLQGLRISQFFMIDTHMWALQAQYVQTNDAREFDMLAAYAHPGGSLVVGCIAVHSLFGFSYDTSLKIFLAVMGSLVTALICVVCYALRRKHIWWIIVLLTLSISWLYDYATPPSALASVFVVLLFLVTWLIFERADTTDWRLLCLWSVTTGLAISTRADIGSVVAITSALVLLLNRVITPKKLLCITGGAFITFAVTDPFMWFMPLTHMQDIVAKALFHYMYFDPARISLLTLMVISLPAFTAMSIGAITSLSRNRISSLVPPPLFGGLFLMTSALYLVFASSQYQAPRYFLPLLFIWETLLPMCVFSLISDLKRTEGNTYTRMYVIEVCEYGVTTILVGSPIIFFLAGLWFNYLSS